MTLTDTRFGRRMARRTGALELMNDLGEAAARAGSLHMLGGGNPARIPAVEAIYRRRLLEIASDQAQFGRFAAAYSAPAGDLAFRAAVAELLTTEFGWSLSERNVGLTAGSQVAFFFLFNYLAGEREGARPSRILLPLAPEYIGYGDLGLEDGSLISRPALIEEAGDGFFEYHVDFEGLAATEGIAALCLSRPTNPSGNVLPIAELRQLESAARARGVPLILDAAYGLPFPGIQFSSRDVLWTDNVILCLSLSKLGLPATRTGIVVAREEIIEALTAFNATASLAPASTGPVIVEPLVRSGELLALCEAHIRPHYESRCRQAVEWLRELCAGLPLRIHRPHGAFFLWLWFPGLPIGSDELYRRLKARGVLVLSGHHFFPGLDRPWPHSRECLRVSYAQPAEQVRAGLEAIAEEVRRAFEESPTP
ncbi:MAG TPA: valine--pyruvate transaminase [Steroidobacteraceae bacterium]|nr:valine--pyruvate transaminase [Steroidobacteraceae bacterium]